MEKAVKYCGDENPSKYEDKLLVLAEVGRRYFEAAFQLSGLTQLNWRGKKKQTNKTNNFF